MLTHSERPVECTMCAQFFPSFNELKTHEMTHCQGKEKPDENHIVPTTIEDIQIRTACLDLTKKREGETVKTTKIKLGFSIEDIMKR